MILWAVIMGFAAPTSPATVAYRHAMGVSNELIRKMRETQSPVAAIIGQVMARRDDMQFLSTVYEETQEASTPRALPE